MENHTGTSSYEYEVLVQRKLFFFHNLELAQQRKERMGKQSAKADDPAGGEAGPSVNLPAGISEDQWYVPTSPRLQTGFPSVL